MKIDFTIRGLEVKLVGPDGLTDDERKVANTVVQQLGYETVQQFAVENGYSSPREMAHSKSYRYTRDYFLGKDSYSRFARYDKRAKNGHNSGNS